MHESPYGRNKDTEPMFILAVVSSQLALVMMLASHLIRSIVSIKLGQSFDSMKKKIVLFITLGKM